MRLNDLNIILAREFGQEQATRLAETITREFSGETLYIPRRPAPPVVGPRDTVSGLVRRFRVAPCTAYRWLADYRRKSRGF